MEGAEAIQATKEETSVPEFLVLGLSLRFDLEILLRA